MTACSSTGSSTAQPSSQARGLPGSVITIVRARVPETPRESAPCGVCRSASARRASSMPGLSRSSVARAASGVTSRGAKPGAAGGEHDVGHVLVAEPGEAGGDLVALVGQHAAPGDLVARGQRALLEHLARAILARAVVHAVGDREHGDPHGRTQWPDLPPSFSSSTTDSICPAASMPFVMS